MTGVTPVLYRQSSVMTAVLSVIAKYTLWKIEF